MSDTSIFYGKRYVPEKDYESLKAELAKAQAALGDAQADLRAVKCGHATPKEARLERELAKAQAELAVWQSTFGTRQNHAEDVEKLKAENARLRDVAEDVEQLLLDLRPTYLGYGGGATLAKIDRELARLRAALEAKP